MTTRVGVLFCLPIRPLRKGYKWTITHKEKNSFPSSAPQECSPLFMESVKPATIPMRLIIMMVVGGIRSAVHRMVYSSRNSTSSGAFDTMLKFVFTLPSGRAPIMLCTTAKRFADTLPITQNCWLLHHSSRPTPLHLNSRIAEANIEMNNAVKTRLAKVPTWESITLHLSMNL